MKLLYTLSEPQLKELSMEEGEEICYCVPVDLQ